jgi:prevent-host-death family protein
MTNNSGHEELAMEIAAAEFKAKCLALMDRVAQTREEIIITKHGKAVAKLVPVTDVTPETVFGRMQDTILFLGDVVSPTDQVWDAESEGSAA